MSELFEKEAKNPHQYTGPDLAMLIVGYDACGGQGYLYCVSGEGIEHDLDGLGIPTKELMAGADPPVDEGVYVWEGNVRWQTSGSLEGDDGAESDYGDGKWRKPTQEEWKALMDGKRPWPQIVGNPEYCAKRDSHTPGVECNECWFGQPADKE